MTIRSVRYWPQIPPQTITDTTPSHHRYHPKPSQIHHQTVRSPEHSMELFSLLHVGISESCHQLSITGTCSHQKRVHVATSNVETDVPNVYVEVDFASSMSSLWMVDMPWYHAVVVDDVQCDDWWHVQGQSLQMTSQWRICYCILRQEPLQKTLCESILFIFSPYCTRCSLRRIKLSCLVLSCLVT